MSKKNVSEKIIQRKAGENSLVLFTTDYSAIIDRENKYYNPKIHAIIGKVLIVISVLYVFLYSFLPSNPEYGKHASTCSNVGRDYRVLFAIWGILVGATLIINLFYLLKKYNIHAKAPRVMSLLSSIGVLGFITFENDKFQKFRLVFTKEQYTGKVTDEVQTFVESIPKFDILFTKKMLHTTFAIIFGLCMAFAILYCLFSLAKKSQKYKVATIIFFGYMIIMATLLGIKLSGLVEAIGVDLAFLMLYIVNYVDVLNDKAIMNPKFTSVDNSEKIAVE